MGDERRRVKISAKDGKRAQTHLLFLKELGRHVIEGVALQLVVAAHKLQHIELHTALHSDFLVFVRAKRSVLENMRIPAKDVPSVCQPALAYRPPPIC